MSGPGDCSGPTASKRLTDHVNRDNSLHQDRLVGNRPSQSTFRSQTQASDQGQNEFNAFMNQGPQLPDQHAAHLEPGFQGLGDQNIQGHIPRDPMNQNNMLQSQIQHVHNLQAARIFPNNQAHVPARPATTPAGGGNWAAEFAAFNARSQPHPQQAVQPSIPQPFMSQQHFGMMNRPAMPTFTPAPVYHQGTSNSTYAPLYDPANRGVDSETGTQIRDDADADFANEMDAWMRSNGTNGFSAGDMATVDAELEAVAREFSQETRTNDPIEDPDAIMTRIANQQDASRETEEITARLAEQLDLAESQPEMVLTDLGRNELGSLPHPGQNTNATTSSVDEETAANDQPPAYSDIADAAGRLIDAVQHETGAKWTRSNFMQLMREFRDGDKIVEDGAVKDASKRGPHDQDDDAPQGGGSGNAV